MFELHVRVECAVCKKGRRGEARLTEYEAVTWSFGRLSRPSLLVFCVRDGRGPPLCIRERGREQVAGGCARRNRATVTHLSQPAEHLCAGRGGRSKREALEQTQGIAPILASFGLCAQKNCFSCYLESDFSQIKIIPNSAFLLLAVPQLLCWIKKINVVHSQFSLFHDPFTIVDNLSRK
jgi:hypothetical protein